MENNGDIETFFIQNFMIFVKTKMIENVYKSILCRREAKMSTCVGGRSKPNINPAPCGNERF